MVKVRVVNIDKQTVSVKLETVYSMNYIKSGTFSIYVLPILKEGTVHAFFILNA